MRPWLRVLLLGLLVLATGFEWEGRLGRLERELETGDAQRRREVVRRMAEYSAHEVERPLLRALEDPETVVRLEAAHTAGEVGLAAAVPVLREWMEAPDAELRAAAAEALGGIGDDRPVGALVRALGDADAAVRRAAIRSLARLGSTPEVARSVAVPLLARLDDDDPEVRIEAARALADLRDARAVVPLVGRARDPAPEVRIAVYHALGELGDARAAAALIQSLRDDDDGARLAALAALGRMQASMATPALRELLASRDAREAQAAVVALGRMEDDEAALDGLVDALGRPETRRFAEDLLTTKGGDALTLQLATRLPEARTHVEAEGVASVVESRLRRHPVPAAAPPILLAIERERGPETVLLRALATTGDQEVLVPILERLDPDDPVGTRAALGALERYFELHESDGRAADPLLAILGDAPVDQRARVVALLGHTGAGRALRALEPLLDHADPELRAAAVEAIGAIGPGGAAALMPLLDSEDPRIRFEVARNVGTAADAGTTRTLLDRLQSREPVDRHALLIALGEALRQVGGDLPQALQATARQTLGRLARDRDERLAARAIDALGRWGDVRALLDLARENGARSDQATLALGRAPASADALAFLRERLTAAVSSRRGGAAAALALGERGEASDAAPLLRLADEGGWPGSAAAAFAVARLGRRGLLGSDQVPGLCAVAARRRSPHLRANLVVALASLGARCDDPEASIQPRSWLRRAHAPVVRGATARWVAAVGGTDAEGVLAGCVDEALAPDVRAACADPRLPPLDGDVDVYVYAVDGRTLLRDTVVALRLADGTSYVVRSDANAQVRLEGAPRGPLGLDDPLASPLEP